MSTDNEDFEETHRPIIGYALYQKDEEDEKEIIYAMPPEYRDEYA